MIKIDIACGSNPIEEFYGFDINKSSKANIIGTALKLPFKNSSIYIINNSHFLEHLIPSEANIFIAEILRVLKKNGRLQMKIDKDLTKYILLKKDKTHKYRYSKKEVVKLFNDFRKSRVVNKYYIFNLRLKNKIFVEAVK